MAEFENFITCVCPHLKIAKNMPKRKKTISRNLNSQFSSRSTTLPENLDNSNGLTAEVSIPTQDISPTHQFYQPEQTKKPSQQTYSFRYCRHLKAQSFGYLSDDADCEFDLAEDLHTESEWDDSDLEQQKQQKRKAAMDRAENLLAGPADKGGIRQGFYKLNGPSLWSQQ